MPQPIVPAAPERFEASVLIHTHHGSSRENAAQGVPLGVKEQSRNDGIQSSCAGHTDLDVTAQPPYQVPSVLETAQELRVQDIAVRIKDTDCLRPGVEVPVQTVDSHLMHGTVGEG